MRHETHASKAADGKCGEAKCGANKMHKHEKTTEAKCGADKKQMVNVVQPIKQQMRNVVLIKKLLMASGAK
jgi:hypothetical protein